jgi:hypothetical protein
VLLWKANRVRVIQFASGKHPACALAFTEDYRSLIVGSDQLYPLNVKSGKVIRTFDDSKKLLAIAGMGPAIRFWDIASGKVLRTIDDFGCARLGRTSSRTATFCRYGTWQLEPQRST